MINYDSDNTTANHRELATLFRHTRFDDGFLFETQILELRIGKPKSQKRQKLDFLQPEDRKALDKYLRGQKKIEVPMEYTTEPLQRESLEYLIGPEFLSGFCQNSWVQTFKRQPVQEWMEGYRHTPRIDLGINFGFPDLDEGFGSTLPEMGWRYPLDFRDGDDTYEWNDTTLYFLPRYRVPLFQVDLFSVRHWIEFVRAVSEHHPELKARLSSRKEQQ